MMNPFARLARCAGSLAAGALALGLLSSCGGGSSEQIEPFVPTRLLVFGDEMSVLTKTPPLGRRYSVNGLNKDTAAFNCSLQPVWTQVLANTYLFAFEECNTTGVLVPQAKIYAKPGAKSLDFAAQVAEALAATGSFTETDLVTVLLGANDVLDLFQNQYLLDPTQATYDAVINELMTRGARLGVQINELIALGPRVILSTMPLMNLTPYAIQLAAARRDPNLLGVLLNFSNTFNTALRVNIVNDGRYIGLVELDALLDDGVSDPPRYGLTNITSAVCAVALPDCTTNTLVANGNALTWLWASDLWMGVVAHQNLGNFARGRALGNPF